MYERQCFTLALDCLEWKIPQKHERAFCCDPSSISLPDAHISPGDSFDDCYFILMGSFLCHTFKEAFLHSSSIHATHTPFSWAFPSWTFRLTDASTSILVTSRLITIFRPHHMYLSTKLVAFASHFFLALLYITTPGSMSSTKQKMKHFPTWLPLFQCRLVFVVIGCTCITDRNRT